VCGAGLRNARGGDEVRQGREGKRREGEGENRAAKARKGRRRGDVGVTKVVASGGQGKG
jgi:hypothetical protein